ncbi:MAG: methyltransferase domain-containing protein [Pyrinomonadaceae bacterium]
MNFLVNLMARMASGAATIAAGASHPQSNQLLEDFLERCRKMNQPKVLELGTKRLYEHRRTKHDAWIPNAGEYLGTDFQDGTDVDIVADVHRLSETCGVEQFDVIISCSTFEHFKYPHVAAREIMKTLKIGGILFIQTHQTYPIHGVPCDYYRFSREALASLFPPPMNFKVISTDYEFPVRQFARNAPVCLMRSFMNVRLLGEKTGSTPNEFIYEFES